MYGTLGDEFAFVAARVILDARGSGPELWLSMLSTLCHFHGPAFAESAFTSAAAFLAQVACPETGISDGAVVTATCPLCRLHGHLSRLRPPEPSLNALAPDQVYFNRHPQTLAG